MSFVDLAQMPVPLGEDDKVAHEVAKILAEERKAAEQAAKKLEEENQNRWPVNTRYKIEGRLGSGAYGQVTLAYDHIGKRHVAIKRSSLSQFEHPRDMKRLLREVAILRHLSHPDFPQSSIVRLLDLEATHNEDNTIRSVYLVLECCDADLRKIQGTTAMLTWAHVDKMMYTLLKGLEFLHACGVMHRDLKPANCLVNEDCTVKICDFGLSRTVEEANSQDEDKFGYLNTSRHLTGHVVTRWYRAPELILLQKNYTEAIDIWSFGCIYAEMTGMLEGCDPQKRRPLFPGGACYPLSPEKKSASADKTEHEFIGGDQLQVIFDVIGSPLAWEIEELDIPQARDHVHGFRKRPGCGLAEALPTHTEASLDLLTNVLKFHFPKRPSASQLLQHDAFAGVEGKSDAPCPTCRVNLPFESLKLDRSGLNDHFVSEIQKFKRDCADQPVVHHL